MASTSEPTPRKNDGKILTDGSTWTAIWHMSWPTVLNMAISSVAFFVDVWVAGKLGTKPLAAIGIGEQVSFFMIMLAIALSTGATALVSRYWGAQNIASTIEAARQCVLLALIFGICSATIGLICCRPFLHLLGATPEVQSLGWAYLKFNFLSHIPHTIQWVTNSIFRAKGNARTPMLIMLLVTILVITLDIGLCLWPFHFGVSGIGISWLVSTSVGVCILLWLLRTSEIGECLSLKGIMATGVSLKWSIRLLKIGMPACIQDLAWIGNFVLFMILSGTANPTLAQASWAIGLRVEEMLGSMPIYAFSMTAATIIGQNIGASKLDRAEKAGWQVAFVGVALNTIMGLLLIFAATSIASMMSNDPLVIAGAAQYFRYAGISQPCIAAWIILFGAMQGAGYTRWLMWSMIFCMIFIRLPLAWYLTNVQHMGPSGTWMSLTISAILAGFIAIWRYRSGVWKTQTV